MVKSFGAWTPQQAGDNVPQVWTNTQTGQQVFGTFDGLSGIKIIDQSTGQDTNYHAQVNGQVAKNQGFWSQLGHALPVIGGVVAGGLGLAALTGGGAAAAGGAGADAAQAAGAGGGMDAGDAAFAADGLADDGATAGTIPLATQAAGGAAPGAMSFLKPALISSLFQGGSGLIGAIGAKSAGNQMKNAGYAAAQTFSPYQAAGLSGLNRALQLNGLPTVAAPGPASVPYASAPVGTMTTAPAQAPPVAPPPAMAMAPGGLPPGPLSSLYGTPSSFSGGR